MVIFKSSIRELARLHGAQLSDENVRYIAIYFHKYIGDPPDGIGGAVYGVNMSAVRRTYGYAAGDADALPRARWIAAALDTFIRQLADVYYVADMYASIREFDTSDVLFTKGKALIKHSSDTS